MNLNRPFGYAVHTGLGDRAEYQEGKDTSLHGTGGVLQYLIPYGWPSAYNILVFFHWVVAHLVGWVDRC